MSKNRGDEVIVLGWCWNNQSYNLIPSHHHHQTVPVPSMILLLYIFISKNICLEGSEIYRLIVIS